MDFLSKMNPRVRRWLQAPDNEESDREIDESFNRWMLSLINAKAILDVGGVVVDRSVLTTNFSCVPDQCVGRSNRGQWRSCCADLDLPLTPGERFRLKRYGWALEAATGHNKPRRGGSGANGGSKKTFWLDADGFLCRPKRRCVFSTIDSRGRIRCRLYWVSRSHGVALDDLQPIACRLFPLVLVNLRRGQVLLTVLNRKNHRIWQVLPPSRFPCLSKPKLPPLVHSMSQTLDWLFGAGFAQTLKRARRRL